MTEKMKCPEREKKRQKSRKEEDNPYLQATIIYIYDCVYVIAC